MYPEQAQTRILVAVCGMQPQVVTGTVYGLVKTHKPFVPTHIHLITTSSAAAKAKQILLDPVSGAFHRLCKDLKLPAIEFDASHIHVMPDDGHRPMSDIRTAEDNRAAADFIIEKVRQLTLIQDSALHVSIAGGRKTMGYYLGYALSLYGRPQDRLSHVLVSEPYDSCPDYFYPTPYRHEVKSPDGRSLDASEAEVTLAKIPFFSLRSGLPTGLLDGTASFSHTVRAVQAALNSQHELVLDLPQRLIVAAGTQVAVAPAELALLLTFAFRVLRSEEPLSAPNKNVPDLQWACRYMEAYRMVVGPMADADLTERALKFGMDGDYFSQRKSKLDKKLRQALGYACEPYRIQSSSTRPRQYGLTLRASEIKVITKSAQVPESELNGDMFSLIHAGDSTLE
jgi:CRISPR-associated protein (TIGR02584 family)